MAPPKRTPQEAHIFEDANPISKQKLAAQAQLAGRGRRGNNTHTANNGVNNHNPAVNNSLANLNQLANASETAREIQGNGPGSNNGGSIDWIQEDRGLLIKYRDAYKLPVQTAFRNSSAHCILSSGIGRKSPTMARQKEKRRVAKEEVAAAVRKHFKEAPVVENECVVEVMYRVRTRDKAFRLKFPPRPTR